MTLTQLKNKVKECGEVRAYWAAKVTWDTEEDADTYYFGQRGFLTDSPYGGDLDVVFVADSGPMAEDGTIINSSTEIHAPSIGHYSW